MHIFKAIEQKLTIVTTSIEQRNFLTAVLDYMQQEPALPFEFDDHFICKWLKDNTYFFSFQVENSWSDVADLNNLDLTFTVKELSAILGKTENTIHQILKRPKCMKAENIVSKNKSENRVKITLKIK